MAPKKAKATPKKTVAKKSTGGKVKPTPKPRAKVKGKRQATAAAVPVHDMTDLVEKAITKLMELKSVTNRTGLFEEGNRTTLEDKIKVCLTVIKNVRLLKDSYKGRLGFSEIPRFEKATVKNYMADLGLTVDELNEAMFTEFATNLAWVDGELQLVTNAYYGMDNMTNWVSNVLAEDTAETLSENLRFILDFLFNVIKLGLRTEKQILKALTPPKYIDSYKGTKLYMLRDDEVAVLMNGGEHEEVIEEGLSESLDVLKKMHLYREARRLIVEEKMEALEESMDLDNVEIKWNPVAETGAVSDEDKDNDEGNDEDNDEDNDIEEEDQDDE